MQVQENISLKGFNTFAVDARARFFARFSSLEELTAAINFAGKLFILGGGSNILLYKDFEGLVLKNEIAGIEVVKEDEDFVFVKSGAGENWHHLVMHCVGLGWGGLENLSLIPGCVGASPMQNIGAYGVEVKDVFAELEAYDIKDEVVRVFSSSDCQFGYRESVFKNMYKGRFVILNVTFRLRKRPVFNISYGAIVSELEKMGVSEVSVRAVSNAVISIRRSKLPDPAIIGNAGSFFKNPVVDQRQFEALRSKFEIPYYHLGEDQYKVPAGWLIEQCGWKGVRKGATGCYEKQALVLVNFGGATGQEVYNLSEAVLKSVKNKFGIRLEREVNIIL